MKAFIPAAIFISVAATIARADDTKQDVTKPPVKAARFSCSPKRLNDGDTLTIRISTPHGSDLGIWGPDSHFYFLVFWRSSDASDPYPIVDWDAFRNMPELRLNTRELRAPILDEGLATPKRVFTKRGTYRILLARNLETENTKDTVNACNVFFTGQAK